MGFCTNSTDISELGLNFLRTMTDIDDISVSSNDNWSDFSSMVDEAEKIIAAMVNFLDFAKDPGSVWFICSMAFAFLSILGTIFFLLLAWKSGNAGFEFVGEVEWSKRHLLTRYMAAPLYILLAILTWFAAGVVFAGTTVNAGNRNPRYYVLSRTQDIAQLIDCLTICSITHHPSHLSLL